MADQILNVTIKGIGDFSDVVSNVNSVQKALTKLKLPDKLGDSFSKNIANFTREYDKYQRKIAEGIKTQGDQNAVDKSLNSMMSSYRRIIDDFSKLSSKDFKEIFNLDIGKFAPVQQKIKSIQEELKKLKLDPKQIEGPLATISKLTKAKPFDKLKEAFATDDLAKAKEAMQEIDTYYTRFESKMSKPKRDTLGTEIEKLRTSVNSADTAAEGLVSDMDRMNQVLNGIGRSGTQELNEVTNSLKNSEREAEKLTETLKRQHSDEFSFSKQVDDIDRQVQSYFGLSQMIRKVGDIARDAFNTVKELDQAMTATAVVTNFSVGDMWNMLPTYTEQANKLGATIKDVYEAATLYYQQGLNTNQAMGLANETLKMARIAGMDAAEATDMMTSALRGFNMEINQTSAQKVNDIYSQLAAVTASDTREIGTAMEKTASLANSANMDIETTSAFLAQMIETTREAPENLGTAMKTIIARFQEMKKDPTSLVDSEGVAMDVNKIDTALKSIGVALTNTQGEFRDLDDVFLDISKKWDSLSQGQQRYIATTAAGSRQQSRFIAMMSNYDRTMELVNEANNSAGASQKQFEKTMDSMSSKLNQLKNAWDEFTMGLMNNQILKVGVTGLTKFFTIVNKIIDVLGGKLPDPFGGIAKSALTLMATLGGLNFGKKFARGSIAAGKGWWEGKGTFAENFQSGFGTSDKRASTIMTTQQMQARKMQSVYQKLDFSPPEPIKTQLPIDVTAYLEKIRNADILDDQAVAEIEAALGDGVDVPVSTRLNINHGVVGTGNEDLFLPIERDENGTPLPDYNPKELEPGKLAKTFDTLGTSISQAGYLLQVFGDQLGPLGGVFSAVGSGMMSVGTTVSTLIPAFQAAQKAGASFGKALLTAVGPMAIIIGVAAALAAAIYLIDKAIETDAEKIERLTKVANTASEAYDSLKQSTSELKSSLEDIQTNEDGFEGLIAGTTEFNDKLTETNQKIDELLLKYPQLNEYLSVDKNGLKHISQEGIDFIKKQQDQLVGNASAQNILQNAHLKAEQDRQKAEQNKRDIHDLEYTRINYEDGSYYDVKNSLTAEEQARVEQLKQESKYLEENAKNSEKIAAQQALAASFTSIEASDRERMASMYVDSYEAAKARVDTEIDEGEMLKTYADYYGYQYDAVGKKVLSSDGKEIEIDKDALKTTYADIVVTADLQASAESLDKLENSVNQKFSKGLKLGASSGNNILSDVLSGNIESDPKLVKKLAEKTPQQIEETLKDLSDAEMSALTGIKEADFAADRDNLRKEFANSIRGHAEKTFEAQTQVYEDLGAKIVKAQGISQSDFSGMSNDVIISLKQNYENNLESIADKIDELSVLQASTLNNVAEKLEENVGLDTMGVFLGQATSIYGKNDKKLTKQFDNIINGIKWESASSRLAGYTKAIKSSHKEIREFGKEMKNTASESNILGEAFDEFVGGDWTEDLRENIDDFQNSLGEIDGAGILKAAEQSGTLKNLLDSDAVSATGVAMALQGIEEGKYSIGEVDGVVLQLLSSLNRLEDASLRAHNMITNFDPGIDTGEGEDFVKDNAKNAKEYYDNGEWGNQQLESYIKLAAGEERWNKTLRKNKGDLHATTKELMKYVNTFKDGFGPAWDQMVNGKTISGKSINDRIEEFAKGDKNLEKRLKQFKARYDENDYLDFNFGDLSTKELETYFQKIYGVSKEYANLLIQDLLNYSGTIKSDLQKNDLKETVRSDEFQNARGAYGDKDKLVLTDAEIKTFEDAGGSLRELAEAAGVSQKALEKNQFRVLKKNGERRDNYADLLRDYAEVFKTGDHKIGSLFGVDELLTNGKLDLNKLIADVQSKSFDEEQSMRAAYEAYLQGEKQGDRTLYEGMEIEHGLKSYEDFTAALEGMTESSQWVQVGETIGTQIVNALNASTFLQSMREGNEGGVLTEGRDGPKFNSDNLGTVVEQIQASGESTKQAQKDITDYLGQSKEAFDAMSEEERAKALNDIASQLKKLEGFDAKKIDKVFKDSFGQSYGLHDTRKEISGMGVSGKKAYDYYTKNGLGNTNLSNRQVIDWGEDPTKNRNYSSAHSWGWEVEQLANTTSTYMAEARGYGKKGNEIQLAFTPMLQGEDGTPRVLSKETVDDYLGKIVEKSRDKEGKIDVGKLMELDAEGLKDENGDTISNLIMGAFQGEGAAEAAGALGELEHFLEEAKEQGYDLQEVLENIKFSPKLQGEELENYVKKIDGLSDKQKTILINSELTGEEKVSEFLKNVEEEFASGDTQKKKIILEATQKFAEGDEEGATKLLKDAGFSEDKIKEIKQKVSILYSGKIANESEFKEGLEKKIKELASNKGKATKVEKKVEVKPTVNAKDSRPKNTKSKHTIETYTDTATAQKKIDNVKRAKPVEIGTKAIIDPAQRAINNIKGKTVDVTIKPNFTGDWHHDVKIDKAAHGKNNYISHRAIPSFGSAAKGRYGTVGPKDKGGLTLTGEKGFEIAWLPSENRSMIVGAGGPQMVNLPSDAVVYTHEQSKDIIKRKSIPAGSHWSDSGRKKPGSEDKKEDKKDKPTKGGKPTSKKKKSSTKEKENTAAISNIIVWWDNITRRADALQRKADKNQKTYEKYLKEMRATLKSTGDKGGGNSFISNTNKAIDLYKDEFNRAKKELSNLNSGTKAQQKAAKTKTKKDDKKANKAAFNAEQGGAVQISYNKGGKKKKSVNEIVSTAKYIKSKDGSYVIDQSQLNKIKNKDKRKALGDALNKEINDRISKKNTAQDNIEKAREALEKFGEELYNTFFKWEIELTKIWNITQKIEATEAKISRAKGYSELLTSQLATGMAKAGEDFSRQTLEAFKVGIDNQKQQIQQSLASIGQKREDLNKLLSLNDEKTTLTDIRNKLVNNIKGNDAIKKAQNNESNKKAALTKANKNVNKEKANKKHLEDERTNLIALKKATKSTKQKNNIQKQIDMLNSQISRSDNNLRKYQATAKVAKENYNKAVTRTKNTKEKYKSSNLNATQKLGYETYAANLEKQINAQAKAWDYLTVKQRADGTIDLTFDNDKFTKAKDSGNISEELGKSIQDYAKELVEVSKSLDEDYENVVSQMTSMYESLQTLQDQWTDYANELWEMSDEQTKKEIDNAKKLNDSLTNSIKKLLDDVKKKLDQRRQQEDNAKTEKDINQKQQRLAALRADTSGGHQVEIAQLESEIADAQQNYQRSLEDQLVDRLQEQADLAAEQRERQIELQEALLDTVNNAAQVDEWMNILSSSDATKKDAVIADMWEAYKTKEDYDKKPLALQDDIKRKFDLMVDGLLNNQKEQQYLKDEIEILTEQKEYTETIRNILKSLSINAGSSNVSKPTGVKEGGTANAEEAAKKAVEKEKKEKTKKTAETAYQKFLTARGSKKSKDKNKGKIGKDGLKAQINRGKTLGKSEFQVLKDLVATDELTWGEVLKAYKDLKGKKTAAEYIKKNFGKSPTDARKTGWKKAFGKAYPKCAEGGLANFTGPAWLDGTPTKPELVLNSKDTRNFIALRDVLDKVMNSSGSTENSYANTEFNININVDKVSNDYDVDKIITKVKKEIIKSAGYRNVTQVRNLR